MKYLGKLIGEGLSVGESFYFDEDGNLINKVDEEKDISIPNAYVTITIPARKKAKFRICPKLKIQ